MVDVNEDICNYCTPTSNHFDDLLSCFICFPVNILVIFRGPRVILTCEYADNCCSCTKNYTWKGLQWVNELEGHSGTSELYLFERRFISSYKWFVVTTTPSCTFSEILSHFTVYVTVCDLEKFLSFEKTVEITRHVRFPIHVYIGLILGGRGRTPTFWSGVRTPTLSTLWTWSLTFRTKVTPLHV